MADRSFTTTLALGLGGGALAAVAAGQDWARASGDAAGAPVTAVVAGSDAAPLSLALALVALAAWGVLLVLRGRPRRAVAVLGAVAAAGLLAGLVAGFDDARDAAGTALRAQGATGDALVSGLTAWYWATWVGGALTLLGFLVAVARSPGWPTMGSRYDNPALARSRRGAAAEDRGATEEELWRALDDGHDPTA